MRKFALLLILCCFAIPVFAQEDSPTPYEIALQRIQEAEASGATYLDLSNLGLAELPPEIGNLNNLQHLDLGFNQLTNLPLEISQLQSLEELFLYYNQLSQLPPEIGNLSNLKVLALHGNQLTGLPPEIGNLTNLQHLNLFDNQLTSLPPEIGNLSSLRSLWLIRNQLDSLPPEIGNLSNLCDLDIRENRFETIPLELRFLKRLGGSCYLPSGLFVDEHLLEQLPEAVQQGGIPPILDYLENEAWWHLQRLIIGGATGFGIVAAFILGMRWRFRGKKKRA